MGNTGSRVQPVINDAQQETVESGTSPLSQQAEQQDPAYLDDLVDAHATATSNISPSTAPDSSAKKKPFRVGLKNRGLFRKKQQQVPSQPIFLPTKEQRLEAELAAANAKVAALTSEKAAAAMTAMYYAGAANQLQNTLQVELQRSANHKAQLTFVANELYRTLVQTEAVRQQQAGMTAHYQAQAAGLISLAQATAASLPTSVENVRFFEETAPAMQEFLAGLGIKLLA